MTCKVCGKTTELMFPVRDFFLCEEHGAGLCCSNCFERYLPNFPERAAQFGEWSGHCSRSGCACHQKMFVEYEKHNGYVIEKTRRDAVAAIKKKEQEGFVLVEKRVESHPISADDAEIKGLRYQILCACDCSTPFARWTAHMIRP